MYAWWGGVKKTLNDAINRRLLTEKRGQDRDERGQDRDERGQDRDEGGTNHFLCSFAALFPHSGQ